MRTNGCTSKIVSLEAARFIAALLVVLHHATLIPEESRFLGYQPLGGYFFPGHMGVEFFFVLSGFIIMHVHRADLGRANRLGAYLRRRASRIYLPYWAVLAVLIPAYLFTGMGTADKRDPAYLLSSILLIPQGSQPVLGVAWTLTHEVLFYAVFGLFILNRRLMVPAIAVWVALILANQWFWQSSFPGAFFFSLYNLLFLAGVGGALLLARRTVPRPALVLASGVAIAAAAWVLELGGHLGWDAQRLIHGAASLLVVLGLVELERSGRLRLPGWLAGLGAASYAIYLVHAVIQSLVLNLAFHGKPAGWLPEGALFTALVVLPVAAGLLFHHWAERPLMRLAHGTRPVRAARGPITAGT